MMPRGDHATCCRFPKELVTNELGYKRSSNLSQRQDGTLQQYENLLDLESIELIRYVT